jgi:hypothetical protein
MAGLDPAIHAPSPQRRGRHHRERYKAYRAQLSGRVARCRFCVAPIRGDGRVKPGHNGFFLAGDTFPDSALTALTANPKKESRKIFKYSEIYATIMCKHGILTSYRMYVYGPRKGVRLGYPVPPRRPRGAEKFFDEIRP